ncbi:MAG: hypothetical protein Q7R58_00550, partial [bacterium]|nr:hypothetical protein [bacterium]
RASVTGGNVLNPWKNGIARFVEALGIIPLRIGKHSLSGLSSHCTIGSRETFKWSSAFVLASRDLKSIAVTLASDSASHISRTENSFNCLGVPIFAPLLTVIIGRTIHPARRTFAGDLMLQKIYAFIKDEYFEHRVALVCPDGTSVARTGVSCTFPACAFPNVSLPDINITFAVPEGFSSTTLPDAASVAAYRMPGPTPTEPSDIIIRRFIIATASGSTSSTTP